MKPKINKLFVQILTTTFEPLLFNMLAIKMNNKIYQTVHFKHTHSLNYNTNKLLVYQFGITHLKVKSK